MRYKKPFVVAALIAAFPVGAHAPGACAPDASENRVVPLLELYTAEGCSSCPPADRLISRWKDRSDVNVLSFHVDYWDAIGWTDRFAEAAFRQRHEARVANSGKNVLYTPQIMVGTETMLDWRFPARIDTVIEARANSTPSVRMSMQVAGDATGLDVIVRAGPVTSSDAASRQVTLLWLVLYENGLETRISAGENKGKTLHHDRVVRTLQGPWPLDAKPLAGRTHVDIPPGSLPGNMGLVLFAETSDTHQSLQSLAFPLSRCSLLPGPAQPG